MLGESAVIKLATHAPVVDARGRLIRATAKRAAAQPGSPDDPSGREGRRVHRGPLRVAALRQAYPVLPTPCPMASHCLASSRSYGRDFGLFHSHAIHNAVRSGTRRASSWERGALRSATKRSAASRSRSHTFLFPLVLVGECCHKSRTEIWTCV